MKNNDTSLNGGNNELQNQNGVTPNLGSENETSSTVNDNLQEMSLGNLNSTEMTTVDTNNQVMDPVTQNQNIDSLLTTELDNKENLDFSNPFHSQDSSMNQENDNLFLVNPSQMNATSPNFQSSNRMDFNSDSDMNRPQNEGNNSIVNSNFSSEDQMNSNPFMNSIQGVENLQNNHSVPPQMNFNTPVMDNPFLNQSEETNPGAMNSNVENFNNQNANSNFFAGVNITENMNNVGNNHIIQTVPTPPSMNNFSVPNDSNKKEKKGLSKTTILIIAIVLISLIGAGIYFILNLAGNKKTSGSITPKEELVMELGKELSDNVNDYAKIQGFDISSCKIDVSEVDTNQIGSYQYQITCGSTTRSGEVIIKDTSAPNIVVKELKVLPGVKITLDDFVVSCSDVSNCSYELEDSSINLDTLVASEGEHKLNLVVSDDYDNQKIVELTLIVNLNAPVKNMYCTKATTPDEELHANVDVTYSYGINNLDELVTSEKKSEYIFDVEEDYLNAKSKYETNENQKVSFDDQEYIITITETLEDLPTEFNVSSVPTDYMDFKQFQSEQGFTCKNR